MPRRFVVPDYRRGGASVGMYPAVKLPTDGRMLWDTPIASLTVHLVPEGQSNQTNKAMGTIEMSVNLI